MDDDFACRFMLSIEPQKCEEEGLTMKSLKVAVLTLMGTMLTVQQAFAGVQTRVPEMDGSGAIIAIGLVIGLVALIREKFFHK